MRIKISVYHFQCMIDESACQTKLVAEVQDIFFFHHNK